ncbi:tetraacyldisaccharide 4'-kinase [Psychroflexus sp. CAK8W]|uniref:Tetraacyldisaccharide 4'-kinase n=1 Tax=Psychroflexus longus TaxID=2873596 RepID=A0ABS7XLW1_9FLAO|nr:tetraacyldisaccharide 4'-kinase [Psychroflexus longus]MBZ9779056.1 tetraacyldisaccharide 4'-kinase [Psychroflexus longus]
MKYLRYLLFPFSVLYGCVMAVRNFLYNVDILKSKSYSTPIICVGNLNTGGTGKSPMIELLIKVLKENYNLATLSRGYKRVTSGFLEVELSHTTSEVGDEPLQFKTNFPEVFVAVDENRQRGISKLLSTHSNLDVILLDDAFQHRKVKLSLSILLTTYGDLYTQDFILPTGNLREFQTGAKRAELIIVTKCPNTLSIDEQKKVFRHLKLKSYQKLFFSTIVYSELVTSKTERIEIANFDDFTLVTGIANPKPLVNHLKSIGKTFEHIQFPDHYEFSESDLEHLKIQSKILTSQKDFMRLKSKLELKNLYYLPIETQILNQPQFLEDFIKVHIS